VDVADVAVNPLGFRCRSCCFNIRVGRPTPEQLKGSLKRWNCIWILIGFNIGRDMRSYLDPNRNSYWKRPGFRYYIVRRFSTSRSLFGVGQLTLMLPLHRVWSFRSGLVSCWWTTSSLGRASSSCFCMCPEPNLIWSERAGS
jgi:hypothetical protein